MSLDTAPKASKQTNKTWLKQADGSWLNLKQTIDEVINKQANKPWSKHADGTWSKSIIDEKFDPLPDTFACEVHAQLPDDNGGTHIILAPNLYEYAILIYNHTKYTLEYVSCYKVYRDDVWRIARDIPAGNTDSDAWNSESSDVYDQTDAALYLINGQPVTFALSYAYESKEKQIDCKFYASIEDVYTDMEDGKPKSHKSEGITISCNISTSTTNPKLTWNFIVSDK